MHFFNSLNKRKDQFLLKEKKKNVPECFSKTSNLYTDRQTVELLDIQNWNLE